MLNYKYTNNGEHTQKQQYRKNSNGINDEIKVSLN